MSYTHKSQKSHIKKHYFFYIGISFTTHLKCEIYKLGKCLFSEEPPSVILLLAIFWSIELGGFKGSRDS